MSTTMNERIKVKYNLVGFTDLLEVDVKSLVEHNITGKLDNYLQKVLTKKDAEIEIDVRVTKTKQEKYDGSFEFILDGNKYMYKNDEPFKNINDLVNHAFDHLKRQLSDK